MDLQLYNTLTRRKEPFRPLDPSNVRMYVCGPTVYDFAHIGNARPVIVFDVLFRLLRHIYGPDHVTYVRNITDVDDKINARAAKRGIPIRDLTEETYKNFKQDVAALGCLPPTVEPRATEHIEEMKALIERLVASGHAYVAEEHVLFSVPSMPDYGKLSRRPLDEMIAGARVDVAPYKRDPMDFVLWKPSKENEPGWPSPCGIATPGRPGWHIECSAMSWKHLGETFDIHGGGIDLVFPHHENEIAQSRCAFHSGLMAQVWMHNGFLQVEGEKMAKSAGNFVTIRELLQDWPGGAIKLAMLQTHYRQPVNWTISSLQAARSEIESWAEAVFDSELLSQFESDRLLNQLPDVDPEVLAALRDDLNTPEAIAAIRALYRTAQDDPDRRYQLLRTAVFMGLLDLRKIGAYNRHTSGSATIEQLARHRALFRKVQSASANGNLNAVRDANAKIADEHIVFKVQSSDGFVSLDSTGPTSGSDQIRGLIEARNAARAAKNFADADRIRDELAAMGVVLKDSKDPQTGEQKTTWEIAR